MRTFTPIAVACYFGLAAELSAQQFLYAPASAEFANSNTTFTIEGLDHAGRQQILIRDSHLVHAIGRTITGIAVRRDTGWSAALTAGTASLTIVMSPTSRLPIEASATFAANLDSLAANRQTVFQGTVTIPASAETTGRASGWNESQDVVSIPFSQPYAYSGGHLCLDFTGAPTPGNESRFWAVDGVRTTARGTVASIGAPCEALMPDAHVHPSALTPGSTTRFRGYGTPHVAGALLIGTPMLPVDLSLFGIGGPQCELHVAPFASLPAAFVDDVSSTVGIARARLQIPAEPSSLGFSFRAQFVAMTLPVQTTNALDCTVAGSLPDLGMATVFGSLNGSSPPTTGVVRTDRAPVLRFELQ